jgi:hypothetical protein
MLEPRDARLASSPPCSTAAKPALSLVSDTLFGLVSGLGDDRMLYSEFADAAFAFARVEAAIGGGYLWSTAEDLDVALDGRHQKWCVVLRVDNADVRDDAALGLLHLDHLSELGRTMKLSTTKDLRMRFKEADELCLRIGHASYDASSRLLHDATYARSHLAKDREAALDLHAGGLTHLRLLSGGLLNSRLGLTNESSRDPQKTTVRLLDRFLGGFSAQAQGLSDLRVYGARPNDRRDAA